VPAPVCVLGIGVANVLQRVAVCCSVLQDVAACCSVLRVGHRCGECAAV